MKVKFITLTCEKYHDNRVQTIRETWGKDQDVLFLSDFNDGSDIIGYDYLPKGYENVWIKYFEFLRNFNSFNSDWYFFTDDDTFVNINNVSSLLSNMSEKYPICIGHVGVLNRDGTDMDGNQTGFPLNTIKGSNSQLPIRYVSGGAGFILSKQAMILLCNYIRTLTDPPRCYNGDVTFGFWVRNSGITVIDKIGFWWTNPKTLAHNEETFLSSYTYHYIDTETMINLYKRLEL